MRNLSLLLLALVCGCASLPPSELEAIRAAGVRSRERLLRNPVGGAGSLAQAQAFVATGEAEEIDYWRFAAEPTSADRDALRTALDGAGAFEVTADKQIVWSLASATDVNLMTAFKLEGGD